MTTADLIPVEGAEGLTLEAAMHVLITFGQSATYRRQVMAGSRFPLADDLPAFLVVNQLVYRGAARPTELADALDTGRSNVSKILRRLEQSGIVKRGQDPRDSRSVLVVLTTRGRAIGASIIAAADIDPSLWLDWSSEEISTLTGLVIKLVRGFNAGEGHLVETTTGIRMYP